MTCGLICLKNGALGQNRHGLAISSFKQFLNHPISEHYIIYLKRMTTKPNRWSSGAYSRWPHPADLHSLSQIRRPLGTRAPWTSRIVGQSRHGMATWCHGEILGVLSDCPRKSRVCLVDLQQVYNVCHHPIKLPTGNFTQLFKMTVEIVSCPIKQSHYPQLRKRLPEGHHRNLVIFASIPQSINPSPLQS